MVNIDVDYIRWHFNRKGVIKRMIELTEGKAVWDRQEGESSRAYRAFCWYRDLGADRSIHKAYQKFIRARGRIKEDQNIRVSAKWKEWATKYKWVERAEAYDDYIEREKRKQNEEAIFEMYKRQAETAVSLQRKLKERLENLKPEELSPNDLIRWFEISTRIERESRGELSGVNQQESSTTGEVIVLPDWLASALRGKGG